MKNKVSRPQSLSLRDLDSAVEQALLRVAQVRELKSEECAGISGGQVGGVIIGGGPGDISGFIARDPIYLGQDF